MVLALLLELLLAVTPVLADPPSCKTAVRTVIQEAQGLIPGARVHSRAGYPNPFEEGRIKGFLKNFPEYSAEHGFALRTEAGVEIIDYTDEAALNALIKKRLGHPPAMEFAPVTADLPTEEFFETVRQRKWPIARKGTAGTDGIGGQSFTLDIHAHDVGVHEFPLIVLNEYAPEVLDQFVKRADILADLRGQTKNPAFKSFLTELVAHEAQLIDGQTGYLGQALTSDLTTGGPPLAAHPPIWDLKTNTALAKPQVARAIGPLAEGKDAFGTTPGTLDRLESYLTQHPSALGDEERAAALARIAEAKKTQPDAKGIGALSDRIVGGLAGNVAP